MDRKLLVLCVLVALAVALFCAGWTWDDGAAVVAASWVS